MTVLSVAAALVNRSESLLDADECSLNGIGELCLFSKNCGHYRRSLAYSQNCQAYLLARRSGRAQLAGSPMNDALSLRFSGADAYTALVR